MNLLSPRAVLARVAGQVPEECRANLIVVGSLAAAYQLAGKAGGGLVRTKDIDCVLVPRVEAVRVGTSVADALLAAGWRHRTEGPHAQPGTLATADGELPVIRLYPRTRRTGTSSCSPSSKLEIHETEPSTTSFSPTVATTRSPASVTSTGGPPAERDGGGPPLRTALHACPLEPSPEPYDPTGQDACRPGPWPSSQQQGPGARRHHRAVGRPRGRRPWPAAWANALQTYYADRWPHLAARVGDGIRALLASEGDLREALELSRLGLLAQVPMTPETFRVVAERLLVDAIEPLEELAHDH